jgi:hypothetical protein
MLCRVQNEVDVKEDTQTDRRADASNATYSLSPIRKPTPIQAPTANPPRNLARKIPLGLQIRGKRTPMPLIGGRAILTDTIRLIGLIKSLEVEEVDAPIEHAADAALPVGDGVGGAGDGGAVAGAAVGGPTRLAVPELGRGSGAGDGLDVVEGLHDVVEVGGGGIADFLGLPVGEGVDEAGEKRGCGQSLVSGTGYLGFCGELGDLQQLDSSFDDCVGGSIGVFVPAVGGTDQGSGEHILDFIDLLEELLSGEVATVE